MAITLPFYRVLPRAKFEQSLRLIYPDAKKFVYTSFEQDGETSTVYFYKGGAVGIWRCELGLAWVTLLP